VDNHPGFLEREHQTILQWSKMVIFSAFGCYVLGTFRNGQSYYA